MGRSLGLALACFLILRPSASAQQLTFTTHVEIRRVETAPPVSPELATLYSNLMSLVANAPFRTIPAGPVDYTVTMNPKEMRVHIGQPGSGTTEIIHSNASRLSINADAKTFMQLPEPPAAVLVAREDAIANLNASFSIRRPGDFVSIAGVRAEHVTFDGALNPLGLPPAAATQGTRLEVSGEAWLAPQHRSYALLQSRTYPMSPAVAPALRQLDDIGFPVRLIIRSAVLGGYEIERTALTVMEEPQSVFEVPEGYAEIYRPRPELTMPRKIKDASPGYTAAAMRAGVEGVVLLEAIVGSDGHPRDVRVVKSLDSQFGLDQAAIDAVRQWEFTPATLGGKPVNVLVTVNIEFKIKGRPAPAP